MLSKHIIGIQEYFGIDDVREVLVDAGAKFFCSHGERAEEFAAYVCNICKSEKIKNDLSIAFFGYNLRFKATKHTEEAIMTDYQLLF